MYKYKISIIVPTIRIEKLESFYKSIENSFSDTWEVIFIGPYNIPQILMEKENVLYIEDWGCPSRCRQLGLINSSGKWICYAADDIIFFEGSLDKAFEEIIHDDYKTVVLGKYLEGKIDNPALLKTEYYYFGHHDSLKPIVRILPNEDYLIINSGLVSTKLLKEIGGWDCRFQTCCIACMDVSIRLQHVNNINIIIHDNPLFFASHQPGTSGDHAPIHYAQGQEDLPLLFQIYNNKQQHNETRIVNLDNWKLAPDKWSRRFK